MSKAMVSTLLLVWLIFLGCFVGSAVLTPALDLDSLTQDSTEIVVGEVISVQDEGQTKILYNDLQFDAAARTGSVRLDQVLKGTISGEVRTFRFSVPRVFIGWRGVGLHEYGIFFFKSESTGTAEFTTPYYPYLPTSPGVPATSGTAIERVIAAVKHRLSTPSATRNDRVATVVYLELSKSTAALEALRVAAADSDVEVKLRATAGLLLRNDSSYLTFAKESLLREPREISTEAAHGLAFGIAQGLSDPRTIPLLTELSVSNDPEVRRAVSTALAHMRSADAVSPLVVFLNDTDFETRYFATVGLAEATGQDDWCPGMEAFRADEAKYLNHWRDWAQTH